MTLVDRYILRIVTGAFMMVLGVLTAIVWLTSSLRQLDLLVSQGSTILAFLWITTLAIPLLVSIIAPFAMFIAFLFALNKLNSDSELIVMSASGLSQGRLLRPLFMVAFAVTVFSWFLTLFLVPASLREARELVDAMRADLITQIIQPGRFVTVDNGLTLHVRDRGPGGALTGVFVNDTRDPELEMTYLGARGIVTRVPAGTFLVLEDGHIVRKPKTEAGAFPNIISFERYAFNLSSLVGGPTGQPFFPPQERWTAELMTMQQEGLPSWFPPRARANLHDRFATPLFVLAFGMIAFAALGRAQTTRQNRSERVVVAIVAIILVRIAGFVASGMAQRSPAAVALIYAVPLGTILVAAALSLGSGPRRGGSLMGTMHKLRQRLRWIAAVPLPLRGRS